MIKIKKIKLILNLLLIPLVAVWGVFFNIIAGAGLITSGYYKIGISILIITALGYIGASVLCWCKVNFTAAVLSIISGIWLLIIRNDFISVPFAAKNGEELYNYRHLPCLAITVIITVLALIKLAEIKKEKKKNVRKKEQAKAPSVFSSPKKSVDNQ